MSTPLYVYILQQACYRNKLLFIQEHYVSCRCHWNNVCRLLVGAWIIGFALCVYCDRGDVEDKLNLLHVCPFYLNEHIYSLSKFLFEQKDVFINTQSVIDSLSKLMSTNNKNILFCLVKFINKCLKQRL